MNAASTRFNFTGIGQRYGFGVTAEYYITKNISTRGSLLASKNYVRFSLAPLFWDYAISLVNEKPQPRGSSYRRPGSAYTHPFWFLAGLLFSDAITYYVPVTKDVYFGPYIAPFQVQVCLPESPANTKGGVLSSSLGAGIKVYHNSLVFYAGAEYSRSFFMLKNGFGYSINASVGYVVLHKKKTKN